MLSQFTSGDGKKTLKDFFSVEKDIYSVGRLDYDSEGLLILTNDKFLNHQLLNPVQSHEREYWVQVEGQVTQHAIDHLSAGVLIAVDGKPYKTKKCKAEILTTSPVVSKRDPPIRFRKNVPDSWIRLVLSEGKNRQVRRMTAQVGFPTLRLIRYRIEQVNIDGLQPGDMKMHTQQEMYNLLKIKK